MIARGFLVTITRQFFGVMDIYVYLVDWQEVTQRYSQGTLEEDVLEALEALEARESWLKSLEIIDPSHNLYCTIADAYQELRIGLPLSDREMSDQFMNPLITFDGYCQDIDLSQSEVFVQAISEDSVVKFADLGKTLDFLGFSQAYYQYCSKQIQNSLARYCASQKPELSFEEGFIPYIQKWLDLLTTAKQAKQGILIEWN